VVQHQLRSSEPSHDKDKDKYASSPLSFAMGDFESGFATEYAVKNWNAAVGDFVVIIICRRTIPIAKLNDSFPGSHIS